MRFNSEVVHFERVADGFLWVVRCEVIGECAALGSGKSVEDAEDCAFRRAIERRRSTNLSESLARDFELPEVPLIPPVVTNPAPNTPTPAARAAFDEAKRLAAVACAGTPSYGSATSPPTEPTFPPEVADLLAQTDVELKRVCWSARDGKLYLQQQFGKTSRQLLTVDELRQFLGFLKGLETVAQPALPFS